MGDGRTICRGFIACRLHRPLTMRVPPTLAARAPGGTAPCQYPSPLDAAQRVGLRVSNGAAPETSERYLTARKRTGRTDDLTTMQCKL